MDPRIYIHSCWHTGQFGSGNSHVGSNCLLSRLAGSPTWRSFR